MADVTRILQSIEDGNSKAAEELLPLVYEELRRLAAAKMAQEKPGQTLQATALVHEAFVRLVDVDTLQHWDSRGHFFAAAAEAMRRILVERARRRAAHRHGGEHQRVDLDGIVLSSMPSPEEVLELDDALSCLEQSDERAALVVKLRFFAGMSVEETAGILQISERTARRLWTFARAWLRQEMDASAESSG